LLAQPTPPPGQSPALKGRKRVSVIRLSVSSIHLILPKRSTPLPMFRRYFPLIRAMSVLRSWNGA